MTDRNSPVQPACGKSCACRAHQVNRRDFIKFSGLTVLGAALVNSLPVMADIPSAGPMGETPEFASLIPSDKHLHADWVKSLFARGEPTVYTKKREELRYIGMPVGGLCCGTVYLGGDGQLWNWNIFNQQGEGAVVGDVDARNGANYVKPHVEASPFEQGFALRVGGHVHAFAHDDWEEIAFQGEYPVGTVAYADPSCPVTASLHAYSPFVPLHADDSGLPIVICEFTVHNPTGKAQTVEIAGWLQNAARVYSGAMAGGTRRNAVHSVPGATIIECSYDASVAGIGNLSPDLPMEDFASGTYGNWTTTGTAFGKGPARRKDIPAYQGDVGGVGDYVVNSHASATGDPLKGDDSATGTLTSPPFTIERPRLAFNIGGGANIDQVGLTVIIDGKVVARKAGHDANLMTPSSLDLSPYPGKTATIQIYDNGTVGWGNVGVANIIQTQRLEVADPKAADAGTMALLLIGHGAAKCDASPQSVFDAKPATQAEAEAGAKLFAGITAQATLAPGQSHTFTYAVAWHFPNTKIPASDAATGHYYATRFTSAADVAAHVATQYDRLSRQTYLWHGTWQDSTLPHWFLERTFLNTGILATTTALRLGTGRFWGWEGTGCCEGTCTHVWHYAQAVGRLFPEYERYVREQIDLGVAQDSEGMIGFRGEGTGPATDGQCGRILGTYREHQMSADDGFLRRVWPHAKLAVQYLMAHDGNGDGLLDGAQPNTLDGDWYGSIPWISSLYAAVLRAGEEMATEMGDAAFAAECRRRFLVSKAAIEDKLFNGEYFIQLPDPAHADALGSYRGCDIDQVMGQAWAWQVNLGRVLDRNKTVSALKALYKYNFAPDVAAFKAKNTDGRPYALAGEGGLIMVTNPQGLDNPFGVHSWQFGYFNECMSGFEHQAAAHMIAEGLVLEGLAVTRAVHDRHHAARRNPYNEIECSDHYSRAMASYGSFIAMCGYEYHGPKGHMAFAPKISPEDFRCAFTAAEGWGTFTQHAANGRFSASLVVKHGNVRLSTFAVTLPADVKSDHFVVRTAGRTLAAVCKRDGVRLSVALPAGTVLTEHTGLSVTTA